MFLTCLDNEQIYRSKIQSAIKRDVLACFGTIVLDDLSNVLQIEDSLVDDEERILDNVIHCLLNYLFDFIGIAPLASNFYQLVHSQDHFLAI
jgi:hypothetical protein